MSAEWHLRLTRSWSQPSQNVLRDHVHALCQSPREPCSIRANDLALTHGGSLMILSLTRRQILAAFAIALAFTMPVAAEQPHRTVYTAAAPETIHAIAAEHGMVVAQEKIAARI